MEGFLSLVIFTVLGQAAAGMVLLKVLFDRNRLHTPLWSWVALILLGLAALVSLGHLSDPLISFYTIANLASSWLSREILFVGLFGASLLGWVLLRRPWLCGLSALAGLGLVIAMSQVYTIQAVPFWNSSITLCSFLTTSILLGASTLFLIDTLRAGQDIDASNALLLGWKPLVVLVAFGVRMVLVPLQVMKAQVPVNTSLLDSHVSLLALGALGIFLLLRNGYRANLRSSQQGGCPRSLTTRASLVVLLFWAGEFCGRALFYSGFSWFGM